MTGWLVVSDAVASVADESSKTKHTLKGDTDMNMNGESLWMEQDIFYAAESDEGFDAANAKEISAMYGWEPADVLTLIKAARNEINGME